MNSTLVRPVAALIAPTRPRHAGRRRPLVNWHGVAALALLALSAAAVIALFVLAIGSLS